MHGGVEYRSYGAMEEFPALVGGGRQILSSVTGVPSTMSAIRNGWFFSDVVRRVDVFSRFRMPWIVVPAGTGMVVSIRAKFSGELTMRIVPTHLGGIDSACSCSGFFHEQEARDRPRKRERHNARYIGFLARGQSLGIGSIHFMGAMQGLGPGGGQSCSSPIDFR